MGWETFNPPPAHKAGCNDIRVSVRAAPRGNLRVVTIRIGAEVAKVLGVAAGSRVNIDIGRDNDVGKLRLIRTHAGGFVLKAQKGRLKEGARPELFLTATGLPGAEPCRATVVSHEIRGETAVLTPPWSVGNLVLS